MVRAVNSKEDSDAVIKPVIHDIWLLLEQHKDWRVFFCYRDANMVARLLAKLAYKYEGETICMEECPGDVLSMAVKDKPCNPSLI